MTTEFIQQLLASEVSPAKARAILASEDDFLASPLLTEVERNRARNAPLDALTDALRNGAEPIRPAEMPELLHELEIPPPALFGCGDLGCLHRPTIAIVGTRGASTYGKACAQKFAEAFAQRGVTVVSGGALGIDAAAHKGALAVEGATAAVLACGVDVTYPAAHAGLFMQIRERGAILSQFACGSKPNEYKFLQRNSLIAALSLAVLVVEAPARSGALSTANIANDIGRPVFVVPANINNPNFLGSFALIRDGATLVDHPDQVLESLDLDTTPSLFAASSFAQTDANSLAGRILAVLTVEPQPTDKIVAAVGATASDVLGELTMLELDGKILRDGPGYAIKP
ncbi:Smf Predicted Rossmann fold nucleotide-binding protein involved in DNA uptake [Fimbriimonadaceae bacterium]